MNWAKRLTLSTLLCAACFGVGYSLEWALGVARSRDQSPSSHTKAPELSLETIAPREREPQKIDSFKYEDVPEKSGSLPLDFGKEFDIDYIDLYAQDDKYLNGQFRAGNYGAVVDMARDELKRFANFVDPSIDRNGVNVRVRCVALACEFEEDWDKALPIYKLLYPEGSDRLSFAYVRMFYSRKEYDAAFDRLIELIADRYLQYPVDAVWESFAALRADPKTSDRAMFETAWTGRNRDVYCLLDQCLQIVDPRLHYRDIRLRHIDKKTLIKANREAREAFKTFVETEYEKRAADPRRSEEEKARVEKATVFLRKLVNLP